MAKWHGRRRHENLPSKEEIWALPDDEQVCPRCGLPLEPQGWTEDSEIVEVEVRAHRRIIRRRHYRRTCNCPGVPQIITAPGPAKLIPKGGYGISFWVFILLGKTKGRGKLDRYNRAQLPQKDIWLYPLNKYYRRILCS